MNGGGIAANGTSTLLCSVCIFNNNIAEKRGGAISFESNETQLLALQLAGSTIRNNSAEYGGNKL